MYTLYYGNPPVRCGVLHGLQVDICSTVDVHGLQGDSLPHHGLHPGCRGISLLRRLEHPIHRKTEFTCAVNETVPGPWSLVVCAVMC